MPRTKAMRDADRQSGEGEGIAFAQSEKLYFRDNGIYIYSSADGKITISADGAGADEIILDGKVTVNDDMIFATGKDLALVGAGTFTLGTGAVNLGTGDVAIGGDITVATGKDLLLQGTGTLTTGSGAVNFGTSTIAIGGAVTIGDAIDIAVNTGTGTKIGTATDQKIGFFNVTPVVQPNATAADATTTDSGAGAVNKTMTFTGAAGATKYTIGDIVTNLKAIGILKA